MKQKASTLLQPILWSTMLLVFSCKKDFATPKVQGFVIGGNDIVDASTSNIDQLRIPTAEVRATGSISSIENGKGTHFCTGFVIAAESSSSNPRIVTNYHCFTSSGKNEGEFADWACNNTRVFLGLTKEDPTLSTVVNCKIGSLKGNPIADISVFEINEPLPPEVKVFELETTPYKIAKHAHIVHHPFVASTIVTPPKQNRKAAVSVITSASCETSIPMGDFRKRPDTAFMFDQAHSCDIIEGSSGAPVIDSDTGKVIAVNWGGISWNHAGTKIENRGVDGAWVAAFLDGKSGEYEAEANEIIKSERLKNPTSSGTSEDASVENKATTQRSKYSFGGCSVN